MAWSKQVGIGSYGSQLRVRVDLRSQSGNSSVIRVTKDMYNGGTVRSFRATPIGWAIGGGTVSASDTFTFDISAKSWGGSDYKDFTVNHNSDGTKTVTVSVSVAATGTSTFGSGGYVSVTFTLPRIPKPPSAPGKPSLSAITATSVSAKWGASSNNGGASVTKYVVERATRSDFAGLVSRDAGNSLSLVLTGLAANTQYWVRVLSQNSAGWSGRSGVTSLTTKPNKPAGITNTKVLRSSDTTQNLSWKNNPSASAPYGNIQIERRDTVNGTRIRLPALVGTATSYRDATTVAGRRYDYYIRPVNAGGDGPWAPGLGVNTTPPAPNNLDATKNGTGIDLEWNIVATQWGIVNHIIEDNPGGTGWTVVATVGNVSSWVHLAPDNAVTHQFRVKTVVYLYDTANSGRLTSAASKVSDIVQLIARPLTPTLLAPTGVIDRDQPIGFQWKHNPVDTTKQTEYNQQYRLNGGAWTGLTGATAQTVTIPALAVSGTVDWQIQTKGQHPDFGPWSKVTSFSLGALPTVAINSPAPAPLGQSRVTAEWGYYQPDGVVQSSWLAILADGLTGTTIETQTGSGGAASASFTRTLKDATDYILTVTVTAANGLTGTDTVAFTTDFPIPVTVQAIPVWDRETGSFTITFTQAPEAAQYAWTGTVDKSPSTKTTAAGTVTNLAVNSSFEGVTGAKVEVHRNNIKVPKGGAGAWAPGGWGGAVLSNETVGGPIENGFWVKGTFTAPSTPTLGFWTAGTGTSATPVTAGQTYELGFHTYSDKPYRSNAMVYSYDAAGAMVGAINQSTFPYQLENAGEWNERKAMFTVPAGVAFILLNPAFQNLAGANMGYWDSGDVIGAGAAWITNGPAGYSDGDYSPDSDRTPSWTGPLGNSASICSGRVLRGVASTQCVTYQSDQWSSDREFSGRQTPTGTSGSYTDLGETILVKGVQQTARAKVRLPAALKGTLNGVSRSLQVIYKVGAANYVFQTAQAPNQIGVHELELDYFIPADADFTLLRLNHGGSLGSGDLWWDDVIVGPNGPYFDGETQSTVPAESLALERQIDGSEWVPLNEGLALEDAISDALPTIAGVNTYRVISRTSLPTEAIGEEVSIAIAEPGWIFINFGPNLSEFVRFYGNAKISSSTSRSKALIHFAGRRKKVAFYALALTESTAVSGRLTPDSSDLFSMKHAFREAEDVCLRTPTGLRQFGALGALDDTWLSPYLTEIRFDLEEVDYVE